MAVCAGGVCQRGEVERPTSCGEDWSGYGDQFGKFPQILGRGGHKELIFGSASATDAQSIELKDALEMREEHLDLLSFPT
jgi:hypothetical protein